MNGLIAPHTSVFRLRLPGGDAKQSQTLGPDVTCGVEIAIVDGAALTAPFAIGEGQRIVENSAPAAEFRRGEPAVDHSKMLMVPCRLVLQLPVELPEGCIVNAPGQLGFREAFDVQVLGAQSLIGVDEPSRGLVNEIISLIRDLVVDSGDLLAGPLPAPRSPLAAGQMLLHTSKASLCLSEEPRGGDAGPVGQHYEVREAIIDPTDLVRFDRRQRGIRHLALCDEADVPPAHGVSGERGAGDPPLDGARLPHPDAADFGDIDGHIVHLDTLGDPERRPVALLRLELREVSALLEEVPERPIQISNGLLQQLGIYLAQPLRLRVLLEDREFFAESTRGEAGVMGRIMLDPTRKRPIPNPAACTGHANKTLALARGRIDPEFVGFPYYRHDRSVERRCGNQSRNPFPGCFAAAA